MRGVNFLKLICDPSKFRQEAGPNAPAPVLSDLPYLELLYSYNANKLWSTFGVYQIAILQNKYKYIKIDYWGVTHIFKFRQFRTHGWRTSCIETVHLYIFNGIYDLGDGRKRRGPNYWGRLAES